MISMPKGSKPMRMSQKSDFFFFFGAPTGKPAGSDFVTYSEPTGLPVGAQIKKVNIKSE